MMLLAGVLLAGVLVLLRLVVIRRRDGTYIGRATGEVDINATGIVLGSVLQTHFAADLLNARLDLLDVVGGVNAFTDDTIFVVRQ